MNFQEPPVWVPIMKRKGASILFLDFIVTGYDKKYFKELCDLDFGIENLKYISGQVMLKFTEMNSIMGALGQRIEEGFLSNFINNCHSQCKKIENISNRIASITNLSELDNNELKEWFEKYAGDSIRLIPSLTLIPIMENILEKRISEGLTELLKEKNKEDLLELYLKNLIFPPKKNFPAQMIVNLTELGMIVQKNPSLSKMFEGSPSEIEDKLRKTQNAFLEKIEGHIEKFGFMNMEYYVGEPMTPKDAISRIKDIIKENCEEKANNIKQQDKETKEKYESIKKELGIPIELQKLIELTQETHYLRQHRADTFFKAGANVRNLLAEIASKVNLSYGDIIFLTRQEIIQLLETNQFPINVQELQRRKEANAVFRIEGQPKIVVGEELIQELEKIKPPEVERVEEVKELSGVIAYPGKYSERVKIVTNVDEIEKVEKGDILVSPMTDPYYVPAMVKAGAIVTDEGGILSHAAIVSRELQVPCIIGTEKATRTLVDNRLIEVDATGKKKGIVRIL